MPWATVIALGLIYMAYILLVNPSWFLVYCWYVHNDFGCCQYQVIDELPPEPEDEESGTPSATNMVNIDDTLNALEEEKQKLLAELNQMEETLTTADNMEVIDIADNLVDSPEILVEPNSEQNESIEVVEPQSHQSLCYQVTTPVIQHTSISRLPSYDKFSDGITEHLPYENLPNSTGTFAKMSGVMKDVKEKMAKIKPKCKSKKWFHAL